MKTKIYMNCFSTLLMLLLFAVKVFSQTPPAAPVPTITGPVDPISLMPATLSNGVTADQVYTTESGMTNYVWVVSPAGTITAGGTSVDNTVTITWTNPVGQQTVSVSYTDPLLGPSSLAVLIINYYPFLPPIDATTILKFVDPLPHFAAGLRVNAKAGGNLTVQTQLVQQVALSTGTPLANGTIGDPATPNAGKGKYAAYQITYNGVVGPAMWPTQTIEAQVGSPLKVQYMNNLTGVTYADFNILADQTLLKNGYPVNGNILTDPYTGPIPMVVHLHGGEIPSNSDGGPTAWFMPNYSLLGPGFAANASSTSTYPNQQEATTLWFHPHDQGLTGINVYTGLAGYYFLRGPDEEAAQLPGWSGDDKVQEVTPAGKTTTFNGPTAYLPEIELAIQDRMFNVNGELYWPVEPPNPDIHPFWTPEFFGDVMTVNGKAWPYLSVAPRKYRFRMLGGCNARFLNLWLEKADGTFGPPINVIGSDAGLLDTPVALEPALGGTLLMGPGERYDVVIDFSLVPAGTVLTLRNDANAPFPDGMPVVPGLTDRIMQFVVNGNMVSATGTGASIDKSQLPANLRPLTPMVKLTDFAGNLTAGVTPDVKRQIILNEVMGGGGPATVLINNAHFDAVSALPGEPSVFGGPTETPLEGSTELYTIINTTGDAHPIHIHLLQWQLVNRQTFDVAGFMSAYTAAWATSGLPEFPAGLGYPGGAGSPNPYNTPNADGAVGGNPAITPFLTGLPIPADPYEMGWKDDIKSLPGEISTYIVRIAPTDQPIGATPQKLLFPFDPSLGPGYVWHCHIVDHEDMDMMRPLPILPSPLRLRFPQITVQPAPVIVCDGNPAIFSVTATSATAITYQWEVSTDAGITWTPLQNSAPYSGVSTSSLSISPTALALSTYQYRVVLTNIDGVTTSNAALLTVNPLPIPTFTADPGTLSTTCLNAKLIYTTQPGMTNYVWTFTGVLNTDYAIVTGGTALSNTVTIQWLTVGVKTVGVNYTDLNGCTAAAPIVSTPITAVSKPAKPGLITASSPTTCQGQSVVYTVPLVAGLTYTWTYSGTGVTLTPINNTVTILYSAIATSGTLSVTASNACGASPAQLLKITVNALPLMPGPFTKSTAIVCKTQSRVDYAVPKVIGVTYNWTYSGTGATISGGTTNSVRINFLNATAGTLSVTATNACGTSPALTLPITVNNCILKSGVLDGSEVTVTSPSATNELKVYPNPASGAVTFEFRIGVSAKATLDLTSMSGQLIDRMFDADVEAGIQQNVFYEKSLAPGVYIYMLRWNNQLLTGKLIITK